MADISTPLSPEMLEKNSCFYCKKYLSYGPVKIYPSGNIGCGRGSSTKGCPGTVSLYEKVAPYLVFPCVYQPQGCSVKLRYNEVKDHEKICPQKKFHCPSCPITLGHNDFFLRKFSNHFENIHDNDILKKPEFFLNINNFDTTKRSLFISKRESGLFMLMFVKFDGHWLYINVSVPHGYGVDNFKQVVTNLGTPKYCSSLGDNSDCFKFFLPRSLDCIAKIHFIIVEKVIRIKILFLPKEVRPDDIPRVKTELDSSYMPELYWDEELKRIYEKKFGQDFSLESMQLNLSLSSCGNKIRKASNKSTWWFVRCSFCESFIWESYDKNNVFYSCTCEYILCYYCGVLGNPKCKYDNASLKFLTMVHRQFKSPCRYKCGSFINMLDLACHEKSCKYNILNLLPDKEFGKLCFGTVFLENSEVILSGKLIKFNYTEGVNRSLFIISHGNQKCIFHYRYKNNKDFFEVEHEYNKELFTAVIQIRCNDGTVQEEQNSFYRGEHTKTYFINGNTLYFVILFKRRKNNMPIRLNFKLEKEQGSSKDYRRIKS